MPKAKRASPKKVKVASIKLKVKRQSFKRSTSTPMSKRKISLDVDTAEISTAAFTNDTNIISNVTKRKPGKAVKNVSPVGSPKLSPIVTSKRTRVPSANNTIDPSPNKRPKRLAKTTSESVKNTSNSNVNGTMRSRGKAVKTTNAVAPKDRQKKADTSNAPPEKVPRKRTAAAGIIETSPAVNASLKDKLKKVNTANTQTENVPQKRAAAKSSKATNTTPVKGDDNLKKKVGRAGAGKNATRKSLSSVVKSRKSMGVVVSKAKRLSGPKSATPKRGRKAKS